MFNLRQANLQELEALIQLRLQLLRETGNIKSDSDTANLAEATRKYLGEKMPLGEFLAWVAEVDNQIVGLVFFQRPPYNGNLSGLEAYVMNVYTIPQWRDQGIATALLREIISFATEAKRLWLHATEDGKRIYEKLSFVSTSKWKLSGTDLNYQFLLIKNNKISGNQAIHMNCLTINLNNIRLLMTLKV